MQSECYLLIYESVWESLAGNVCSIFMDIGILDIMMGHLPHIHTLFLFKFLFVSFSDIHFLEIEIRIFILSYSS
jgi:membrane protease subunit (stomatin/prohibitin family)